MEADYWLARWVDGRTGFHRDEIHPFLARHEGRLGASPRSVLVPLCGKATELRHLAERGHHVTGVELSPLAAGSFFSSWGRTPSSHERGGRTVHEASGEGLSGSLRFIVGDFFDLTPDHVGSFDACFDRAAIVALPPELRRRHASALRALLSPGATVLMVTFEYPQDLAPGPPFSVPRAEVEELFGSFCDIELVDEQSDEVSSATLRERGVTAVLERAFVLTVRPAR